jgi:hypothetical protein
VGMADFLTPEGEGQLTPYKAIRALALLLNTLIMPVLVSTTVSISVWLRPSSSRPIEPAK